MKYKLLLLIFTITTCCTAQIIPIEEHGTYEEIPDGAYVKDVSGLLNKFIGTWEGYYENKKFILFSDVSTISFSNSEFDLLKITYQIEDENGNIIIDTTTPSTEDVYVIEGMYFQDDGTFESYVLHYIGYGCGQGGNMYIWVKEDTPDEMILNVYHDPGYYMPLDGCPNGLDEILFPTGDEIMTLTKQ